MSGVPPDPWSALSGKTPARIALGRAGPSLPTREVLGFALAHAQARDAVHAPLDVERVIYDVLDTLDVLAIPVTSAAANRDEYLRRPDRGRRLSEESRAIIGESSLRRTDLAIVIGDGLSAAAVHEHAVPVLTLLLQRLPRQVRRHTVFVASQCRVALGDEIAGLVKARAVAVLLGERPGLSSPSSLGIYLTWAPKVGRTDAERNCISNIRAGGLTPEQAARKAEWLLEQAFARKLTGVGLKDESDAARLPAADTPQLP
jgi:ethanolamine ammonia-lyase small subunit